MRRSFFFWVSLALAGAHPVFAQRVVDQRLVQGYTEYVGGLLGLDFTAAERAVIRQHVEGYWAAGERESMETVRQAAANWDRLKSEPAIVAALPMTRPDALLGLQTSAQSGRADSRYLLGVYYQRNPILAPGKPGGLPLTRDMVESELALKHWLATEIHRQRAAYPDASVVDRAVRAAIEAHPRLSAAEQVAVARQPGEWARVRYGWGRVSATDKLLTRAEMGARLTPQEQAQVQQIMAGYSAQINGMVAQHRNAMWSGAIQGMKQNSEIIMGRGTVWNPASGRWEQQGGIVTEYNRVVRVP